MSVYKVKENSALKFFNENDFQMFINTTLQCYNVTKHNKNIEKLGFSNICVVKHNSDFYFHYEPETTDETTDEQ